MKKIFLIILFSLFAISVQAGELFVIYEDLITAADSGTVRTNTVYSPWTEMKSGRFLNCEVKAEAWSNDTNWIDDSLFYALQLKFAGSSTITTILIDTLFDVGSVTDLTIYDADATVLPPLGRLRVIHWDSIGVGAADADLVDTGIPYIKKLTLLYNWR